MLYFLTILLPTCGRGCKDKDLAGFLAKCDEQLEAGNPGEGVHHMGTTYVRHNWLGIVNAYHDPNAGGSCAEGLVSHYLSARLSSRPMGWSGQGLAQMSNLLEYKHNQGDFKVLRLDSEDEKERENEKLSASDIPEMVGVAPKDNYFAYPTEALLDPKVGTRRSLFLSITEGGFA